MRYEIVWRSMNTGAIVSIESGFDTETDALSAAESDTDESVWAEVRPEHY